MDILSRVVHRITSTEKLVNGDEVLLIYYGAILIFFLFNRWIDRTLEKRPESLNPTFVKVYKLYRRHTYILINIILYIICCILLFKDIGFDLDYLLTLTLSFVTFTIIFEIFLKIFIDEDSYKNANLLSYLNVIYYIIVAGYFSFFSPFVGTPQLLITFAGSMVGLTACIYIMIRAILNPQILRRRVDASEDVVSYGILRGMLGIVICIALIEYLMIFACFKTDPGFYGTGEGRILNAWDMLYFFVISFSTIGYGDIYPQQFNGMFYSEFTSIIIGITSMFTTACFVAAVISTASSLARSDKTVKKKSKKEI